VLTFTGRLALSRGLGDFEYKKNADLGPEDQATTANPDVLVHRISDEDEFLVLASDGIWECMSSQAVINFVRRKLHEGKDLCEVGELLCDYCVYPEANYEGELPVGNDNMTVLVVAILNGRTKEEWYSWVHDRVESNYGYATPARFPLLHGRTWTRPKPPADKKPKEAKGNCRKDDVGSTGPTTTGTTMKST